MHIFFLTLLFATRRPDGPPAIEPAAMHTLEAMARAYHDLHRLDQETTYSASEGAQGGLLRSRLLVDRPNRLLMEFYQQSTERAAPYLSRFQSDGKNFYAYQERQGWYTKAKAPKSLKELDFLAVSLEMAVLTGHDPVSPWTKQAHAIRLEDTIPVDGAPADVVLIDMSSPERISEVRLYIDQNDHLLRRFAFDTRAVTPPRQAPPAGQTGEPPVLAPVLPVHFSYDNHVHPKREWTKDAFVWVAPAGSFQYQQYPSVFEPTRGAATLGASAAVIKHGIKHMKIIPFKDLLKHARKPNDMRDDDD